jgi:hypothetical protein
MDERVCLERPGDLGLKAKEITMRSLVILMQSVFDSAYAQDRQRSATSRWLG